MLLFSFISGKIPRAFLAISITMPRMPARRRAKRRKPE